LYHDVNVAEKPQRLMMFVVTRLKMFSVWLCSVT